MVLLEYLCLLFFSSSSDHCWTSILGSLFGCTLEVIDNVRDIFFYRGGTYYIADFVSRSIDKAPTLNKKKTPHK